MVHGITTVSLSTRRRQGRERIRNLIRFRAGRTGGTIFWHVRFDRIVVILLVVVVDWRQEESDPFVLFRDLVGVGDKVGLLGVVGRCHRARGGGGVGCASLVVVVLLGGWCRRQFLRVLHRLVVVGGLLLGWLLGLLLVLVATKQEQGMSDTCCRCSSTRVVLRVVAG